MIYRRGWVPVLHRYQLEKKLKDEGFENYEEITSFLCGGRLEDERSHFAYQVVDNTEWMSRRDAKFWQRQNRSQTRITPVRSCRTAPAASAG
ncbi:TPA: hypothetical protein O7115_004106 [Salmonella enterica]|nr:hypothetical protein [Salmonella enterica]HDC2616251.1 hypothetical protein [Salmonella enterica]